MTRPITVLLAALLLAGCGKPSDRAPRAALGAFLERLAAGDPNAVCRNATTGAVRELARDFGGRACPQTVARLVVYLRGHPAQEKALRSAVIQRATDIPLSPAPYRAGTDVTRLRVAFRDPVLGRRQKLDLTLRRQARAWRVDAGVAGLFTLLEPVR